MAKVCNHKPCKGVCLLTFADIDECINFITDIKDEKVILITSGSLGQQITPCIHEIPQLDSIYVFLTDKNLSQWKINQLDPSFMYSQINKSMKTRRYLQRQINQLELQFVNFDEYYSSSFPGLFYRNGFMTKIFIWGNSLSCSMRVTLFEELGFYEFKK